MIGLVNYRCQYWEDVTPVPNIEQVANYMLAILGGGTCTFLVTPAHTKITGVQNMKTLVLQIISKSWPDPLPKGRDTKFVFVLQNCLLLVPRHIVDLIKSNPKA